MAFLNYTPSHPRIINELCLVLRIYNTDIDDLLMDQPNQTTFPLQEMKNKLNVDNINLFIGNVFVHRYFLFCTSLVNR